jgi:hypothetical protein
VVIIPEICLDLVQVEVDEKTCDPRCTIFSNQCMHIVKDILSCHLFKVRILWNHGWEELEATLVVSIDDRVTGDVRATL